MRSNSSGIIGLFLAMLTGNALAAPELMPPTEEDPWYQVNIVIFRQPGHLLQSEQWKTGEEVNTRLPNNLIALEEALPEEIEPEQEPPTEQTAGQGTQGEILMLEESGETENVVAELPVPFVIQTPSDEEFTKALNRLNRSSYYDILFQKTWLQPPLEEKHAMSILVQAGEVFDGFYELEGTAKLHVSRYLHFSSHMWLSKYVKQIEVIKPWWQETGGTDDAMNTGVRSSDFSMELGQSLEFEDDNSGQGNELSLSSLQPMDPTITMGETITRYQSIRTAVMEESRRMRSGELHYLDHPLFGVIVKVVPYYPEPEEAAEENDTLAALQ